MDPRSILADLDDDQRRAVTTESLLVAVVAGAGSGKTRVLTRRIAYRVATGTADEAHTVVLTFTREAAGELRRRLPRLGLSGRVTAGTFHSVGLNLLQQRWRDLDERPWTVEPDRRRLVERWVPRAVRGNLDLDELIAELDWATARLLDGTGYEAAVRRGERSSHLDTGRVGEALDRYQSEKRTNRTLDFDDVLGHTIDVLRRDQTFADIVRWRYRHVLVDEAQDLNPLQHRLIDELRAGRDDLFLVGDPAQAIYGFNGADPALLLDVSNRFPGVEVVRLPTNHRSTPQIVDTGAYALRADGQPTGVRSARPEGATARVVAHADERAEAAGVAAEIARLDPSLVRANQIAVLARTNAQLPSIRAALADAGVATRRPVHGVGGGGDIGPLLGRLYRSAGGDDLRQFAQDALDGCDPDMSADKLSAEQEVGRALLAFLRVQPTAGGPAFRTWVDTTDPFGRTTAGVEVLTFHGAKGREWHTVHLVGCETSLVPHRTATTAVAKAEEARLLYVAATRATDVLVINWAQRRGGYQRRLTPLLDGFVSTTPEPVAAPEGFVALERSDRERRLDRLRAWRAGAARHGGLLPEALVTDAALAAIADHGPDTPEALDTVTGLGPITSHRLFGGIRDALGRDGASGREVDDHGGVVAG